MLCFGCHLIKVRPRVFSCPARALVERAVPDWQERLTASHEGTSVQLTVADWLRLESGVGKTVGQRAPANPGSAEESAAAYSGYSYHATVT